MKLLYEKREKDYEDILKSNAGNSSANTRHSTDFRGVSADQYDYGSSTANVTIADDDGAFSFKNIDNISFSADLSSGVLEVPMNETNAKLVLAQTKLNPAVNYNVTVKRADAWRDAIENIISGVNLKYNDDILTGEPINFVSSSITARGDVEHSLTGFTFDLHGSANLSGSNQKSLHTTLEWSLVDAE